MSSSALVMSRLLLFGCTLLVLVPLGAWLVWTGLWPRRRGETLYCGACGYNLTGNTSERCSECAVLLTDDRVVRGERRRSPIRIVGGLLCLAPLLLIAGAILANVDWYGYSPASWLLSDLQGPTPIRAWRELDRRIKAGTLSAAHRSRLIDLALQRQAATSNSPVDDDLMQLLGDAFESGVLSESQAKTFTDQLVTATLRIRPRVGQGRPVPFELARRGSGPSTLWIELKHDELWIGDRQVMRGSTGSSGMSGRGSGGWSSSSFKWNELGRHRAEARMKVRVFDGSDTETARLLYEGTVSAQAEFDMVPAEEEPPVEVKADTSLEPAMRAAVEVEEVQTGRYRPSDIQIQIKLTSIPANVAFEVIVRSGGHEQRVSSIYKQRAQSTSWSTGGEWKGPPMEQCDVILRSSAEVARGTVDLFEIWGGELVYENVPVKLGPKAATQTAPASP